MIVIVGVSVAVLVRLLVPRLGRTGLLKTRVISTFENSRDDDITWWL